jgi:hypothetical protein
MSRNEASEMQYGQSALHGPVSLRHQCFMGRIFETK